MMGAVQYANAVLAYSKESVKGIGNTLEQIHFIDKDPKIVRLIQKTFKTMISENKRTDYNVNDYVKTTSRRGYKVTESRVLYTDVNKKHLIENRV